MIRLFTEKFSVVKQFLRFDMLLIVLIFLINWLMMVLKAQLICSAFCYSNCSFLMNLKFLIIHCCLKFSWLFFLIDDYWFLFRDTYLNRLLQFQRRLLEFFNDSVIWLLSNVLMVSMYLFDLCILDDWRYFLLQYYV